MEVTPVGLALIPVTVLAVGLPSAAIVALLRVRTPARPLSECLLAAGVATALGLWAEIHLLSLVPGSRPLDWLPAVHGVLAVGLLGWTTRAGGWRALRDALRRAGGVGSSRVLIALAAWLGVFALYGAYLVPGTWGAHRVPGAWDVLSHYLPMAIQPYQDGRLGPVLSDLPWAETYPRGVPLLWYWTLQWTGTDLLFNPVQLAFGVQLLLAAYVLARRSGVPLRASVLAVFIVGTMPVFFMLATSGYIDLPVAATAVTAVAFLAPPREPDAPLGRDWLWVAAAIAECCLIKLPLLPAALAGLALAQTVLFRAGWRRAFGEVWRFLASKRGVLALLLIALGCHQYIGNWIAHGNPVYPLRVSIAGVEVFGGTIDPAGFGSGAQSTFGDVQQMRPWQRFLTAWSDFRQPLTMDSLGSFGPVFLLAVLVPFVIFVARGLWRRQSWPVTLGLMFGVGLFTPAFVPRYGLSLAVIAVVGAADTLARLSARWWTHAQRIVVVLCVLGAVASGASIFSNLRWIIREAGGSLPLRSRNAFLYEKHTAGLPSHCSPELTRYLHEHSGAGDTLAWNVMTFHGLLWNPRYTNRVIHLPGTPRDIWPARGPGPSPAEIDDWCARLSRLHAKHVLVYANSPYADCLRQGRVPGYHLGFADPADRPYAMIVFARDED
ncbi:MAG: hypothetical protein PVJ57_18885 [Phycisphaerae bacterium]|jgi:hypothetical protein